LAGPSDDVGEVISVRTVQLRRYTVAAGQMERWVGEWRERVVPLREAHGFEEADAAYYASPERVGMDPDPARYLVEVRTDFVREVS
jgi:hypothetical protein